MSDYQCGSIWYCSSFGVGHLGSKIDNKITILAEVYICIIYGIIRLSCVIVQRSLCISRVISCQSMFCGDRKRFLTLFNLTRRDNERRGIRVPWLSQGWLNKCVLFSNRCIFITILYIMPSQTSVCLSSRLFKCCNMSPTLDVVRCLLVTNLI